MASIPKWLGDLMEGFGGPDVTVIDTAYITPAIKKIRFQGNISRMNFQIGCASVIRVSNTEYRNYTVSYHNIEKGILEIVFYIHSNGAGSQYIDTLKTGDKLHISNPRGIKQYDPKVKQYFIFGDETSLGLTCSFLPVLKKNRHQFQFYFELDEASKNAPQLLGLENYTVFPKKNTFRNQEWISDLSILKTSDWQAASFILSGNVISVQTFRKVLKNTATGKILAQGYWLEGKKGL